VRLLLNQIVRRLTEQLPSAETGQDTLLMLDELPVLGRLDFLESTLAFMAGYRVRAFLITQSLNQIEKAYGPNNAILDNCHVRVSFATNDERTAKRVSEALGTATEERAMRNYAGHRLSPWLGHLMVSKAESPRPLLTPGEVMQLPPDEEVVMVSGVPPIRAHKARYFKDPRLVARVLKPPAPWRPATTPTDDWTGRVLIAEPSTTDPPINPSSDNPDAEGPNPRALSLEPDLTEPAKPVAEFSFDDGETDAEAAAARARRLDHRLGRLARQASLDPDDGLEL
jgi:type IV secretion system protein VirD4